MKLRELFLPAVMVALIAPGCAGPQFSPEKVRVGMTEDQTLKILGKPTMAVQEGNAKYFEYESFELDKWFSPGGRKENVQAFVVRLVDGKVESFGKRGEIKVPPAQPTKFEVQIVPVLGAEKPAEVVLAKVPAPGAFDLRSELEKLEKMKKDGLISEAEFKELRQRALDKAKTQ